MLATALVLVAALLHAAWNTLIKFSAERLLVVACMDTVALLCVALAFPFISLPPPEIWPWILASAAFELLYRYLLIQAYRVGDLGLVYPLMRGLSPLVVLLWLMLWGFLWGVAGLLLAACCWASCSAPAGRAASRARRTSQVGVRMCQCFPGCRGIPDGWDCGPREYDLGAITIKSRCVAFARSATRRQPDATAVHGAAAGGRRAAAPGACAGRRRLPPANTL